MQIDSNLYKVMLKIKIILRGLFINVSIFFIGALMIDKNMIIFFIGDLMIHKKLSNFYPILPLLLFMNFCFQWYVLSKNPKSFNKTNWLIALINFVSTIILSLLTIAAWYLLLAISGIPKNRAPENYSTLYQKEDYKKINLTNSSIYSYKF